MSIKNRRKRYEMYKDNTKTHLLSAALKREFEPDSVTEEAEAKREAKEKETRETQLKKDQADQLDEIDTPGAQEKLTEEELYKLNKKEQVKILNGYNAAVPNFEKARVDKILELQNA